MSKEIDFCYAQEIYSTNMAKNYWILVQKQNSILQKSLLKKVFHKRAERELIESKIAEKIVKTKLTPDENSWNVEEIVFLRKERQKLVFFVFALVKKLFLMFLIKLIKKKYYEIKHYKISELLNDSTVSKFLTRKWIKINDLSNGQYSVNKNIKDQISMNIKKYKWSNLCN